MFRLFASTEGLKLLYLSSFDCFHVYHSKGDWLNFLVKTSRLLGCFYHCQLLSTVLVSIIWPVIELVWVEVGAEAQLRNEVAVGRPRCEGGGEEQHGRGGDKDSATGHPGTQVAVVVDIGVH